MNSPGSTTSGIDSVDCESLLWNLVCSDLQREKMTFGPVHMFLNTSGAWFSPCDLTVAMSP